MTSGTKLILAGIVVVGTTAYMAYLGAAESWQYYLTTDECLRDADSLMGCRLRVSGRVAVGTLDHDHSAQQVSFGLAGTADNLPVNYRGVIPDNLAEGIEVVVEGRLDSEGNFVADKLLTKCASKYASDGASEDSKSAPKNAAERAP